MWSVLAVSVLAVLCEGTFVAGYLCKPCVGTECCHSAPSLSLLQLTQTMTDCCQCMLWPSVNEYY